jgi:hypothetical protein
MKMNRKQTIRNFDKYLHELAVYERLFGRYPKATERNTLAAWIEAVRFEYKVGRLSVSAILKLNKIGFPLTRTEYSSRQKARKVLPNVHEVNGRYPNAAIPYYFGSR